MARTKKATEAPADPLDAMLARLQLPGIRDQLDSLLDEAARANLHHVGSVWRNNTMHPAGSYTQSQALDVFNAVRVFMSGLAAL